MYKVTISDLHLGEGILYEDGTLNPLEDFLHDRSFYKFLKLIDEKYREYSVCLNLLGDIFEGAQDPPHEEAALERFKKIIKGHPLFFKALNFWTKRERP